jgi:beta-glucosidase
VFVGYRYFTTFDQPVRYPFGHGLSYTTFSTAKPTIETDEQDRVAVTVDITNTGQRYGKHVVQVYVSTDAGPVRRPLRELRGFEKVGLEPGQSTAVRIELPRRAFAYWNVDHNQWVVAPGEYRIQVCADATQVLHEETLTLAGDEIVTELTMDTAMGEWFAHPRVGERVMQTLGFTSAEVSPEHLSMMASMTMQQFINISGMSIPTVELDDIMQASRPL